MIEVPIEELRANFCYTPTTGVVIHKVRKTGGVKAMQPAGSVCGNGYLMTKHKGVMLMNHRIAFALFHGRWPDGEIDHIDRNKLNNRIENLREATSTENKRNADAPKRNTSGIRGVNWNKLKGKWQARISVDGKQKHLGLFANIIHAAMVRRIAEHAYWSGIHELKGQE